MTATSTSVAEHFEPAEPAHHGPGVDAGSDPAGPAARRRRTSLRALEPASAEPLLDAPIRRWARHAFVADIVAAVGAGVAARLLRFGFEAPTVGDTDVPYAAVAAGMAILWPLATVLAGAFGYRVSLFGVEELRRLLRAGFGMFAAVGFVYFVFKLDVSRGFVGIFIPLAVVLSGLFRFVLRSRLGRRQDQGVDRHRAVVVGPVDEIERLSLSLRTMQTVSPIDIVAFVADDLSRFERAPALGGLRRLRSREEIDRLAEQGIGFDVLLYAGQPESDELWSLARRAHQHGVALAMAPGREDHSNVGWTVVPLGSTPLLLVESPAMRRSHAVAKAVFDRVGAVLLLLVLSPLLLVTAAAVAIADGRPVFFRHERVGRDGAPFRVWKFRTMKDGSDSLLFDLLGPEAVAQPLFKVKDDPRITRLGGFLRRHSLDELPQLFNVLAGQMSLVGPRPQVAAEVATYDERAARRLLVKPGMTGLWQTQGRNDIGWDEGVYLDLLYIDHWSPLLDLVIMARTLRTVLSSHGAY